MSKLNPNRSSDAKNVDKQTAATPSESSPLKPIATGSNGTSRSTWPRQRSITDKATHFVVGIRGKTADKASKPVPIPIPVRPPNAQAQTWVGAQHPETARRVPDSPRGDPTSSVSNSRSSVSTDDAKLDLLQALAELPKTSRVGSTSLRAPSPKVPKEPLMDFWQALAMEPASSLEPTSKEERLMDFREVLAQTPTPEPVPETVDAAVLEPARQRDQLLFAARQGNMIQLQEAQTAWATLFKETEKHLPAAVPDWFLEDIWARAQRHFPKFDALTKMYLTQCRKTAEWHHWVQDVLRAHPKASTHVAPGVQAVCDLLRTTREADLPKKIPAIAQTMHAALEHPRLERALAEQPFTSLQAMLDKCKVLTTCSTTFPALKPFRDALDAAFKLQSQATATLRVALPEDAIPLDRARTQWRSVFARLVTASPDESLGAGVAEDQRKAILARLEVWRNEQEPPHGDGWDHIILKRLCVAMEKSVMQKSRLPIDKWAGGAEGDAT